MMKKLFFLLIIHPIVLLIAGVHVKGREHLPTTEASIIISNHNSHLDTMILMSLYPIAQLDKVRPVAAWDYFMKNRWVAWFSQNIIGIIPLKREVSKSGEHPFAALYQALEKGETIILFPEGSRGEPEEMRSFKTGIAHLAREFPHVPIIPSYIYGAGKALPRGEALFVPFIIDVVIGEALYLQDESNRDFTNRLKEAVCLLEKEIRS
jgi:1-acyl-sn-glycerol-3-phosphate acyltransferase